MAQLRKYTSGNNLENLHSSGAALLQSAAVRANVFEKNILKCKQTEYERKQPQRSYINFIWMNVSFHANAMVDCRCAFVGL